MWGLSSSRFLNASSTVEKENIAGLAYALVSTESIDARTEFWIAWRKSFAFIDVLRTVDTFEASRTGTNVVALTNSAVSTGFSATL